MALLYGDGSTLLPLRGAVETGPSVLMANASALVCSVLVHLLSPVWSLSSLGKGGRKPTRRKPLQAARGRILK